MRCPICEREFQPGEEAALPFCSRRCKQIDLARWLGEGYGLPIEREEGDAHGQFAEDDG